MRSLLAVPATHPRFIEKAAQSRADAVFLDLEDAVVPELKQEARAKAIEAIDAIDWGRRAVGVRVNDLGTPWGPQELVDLGRQAKRLDFVILPKCETPADVARVEAALGSSRARLVPLIETAKGVANVEAIAAAGTRMMAMLFGPGDYALDLGVIPEVVRDLRDVIPGDAPASMARDPVRFEYALARIANACRAYGLAPIDGPFFDIGDPEGCRAECARAAALGYEGKMAIHPSQIEIANEAFSPGAAQVAWAREVLEAMAAAGGQGRGAVKTKDGKMIDLVHIKIARKVLERADRNSGAR